jgi:hypothetical protein
MQLTDTLSLISQSLLIIALPIVIFAAVQHIRVMGNQLRSKFNVEQQQTIDRIIGVAVKAAEQAGGIKGLVGAQKQQQAIDIAQRFLAERGIKMDVGKIVDLIEAQVYTQFTAPTPIADTAESRQALVNSAVQASVQAAEQSGLSGLIQNVGQQKKDYALQMASQYLGQYGVKLDPNLLSGLIESQVLNARQQRLLPAAAPAQPQAVPQAAPSPAYSPTTGLQPGG